MKKVQDPTQHFYQQAEKEPKHSSEEIRQFAESLLSPSKCPLCRAKYHLKDEERVPRILLHCGHTFCTSCLLHFHINSRVRCPMCLKLIKKVHSIQALPINHTIFTALSQQDQQHAGQTGTTPMASDHHRILYSEFIREAAANLSKIEVPKLDSEVGLHHCPFHRDRIEHFFCMFHETPGCRKCMEEAHKLQGCKVLDLYELRASKGNDQMLADIQQEIQDLE